MKRGDKYIFKNNKSAKTEDWISFFCNTNKAFLEYFIKSDENVNHSFYIILVGKSKDEAYVFIDLQDINNCIHYDVDWFYDDYYVGREVLNNYYINANFKRVY